MSTQVPPRPDLDAHPIEEGPGDGRLKATWRWWEVLVFSLAGFLAASVAATPLFIALDPSTEGPIGQEGLLIAAVIDVVIVAVLLLWLRAAHPGWARVIGWPAQGRRVREVGIGAGLGLLVELGSFAAGAVVILVLESATGETVRPPEQVSSDIAGWGLAIFAIFAILLAPAAEEFVFRGLLFRSVADRHGFWPGAIASAVPFGLTHVIPGRALDVWALILTLIFVGIGFAWVHWRRRNLLANIVAHATFNVIGVVLVLTEVRV
jgi:membrane protease YdiL (CAAX protease family)